MSTAVSFARPGALGHERRLTPGRGTGVEHRETRLEAQGKCGALRAEILHRHDSLRETGQILDLARRLENERLRHARLQTRADAGRAQGLQIIVSGAPPVIHTQPHRRLGVARGEQLGPADRPVGAKSIREPLRRGMAKSGVSRDIRVQRAALAQVAPQYRIDEPAGARGLRRLRSLHRRVHDRVFRGTRIFELEQRHGQEGAYQRIQ
jgi:hypothetical protein